MRLGLSTRLILNSLLLSAVPIIIISLYAIHISSIDMEYGVQQQLVLEREARVDELNTYLDAISKQLVTWSENGTIVNTMKDFTAAFAGVEVDIGKSYDAEIAANEGLLKARYAYQESNTPGAPADAATKWWPKDRTTRILQHYYIAANPYPIEKNQKSKLDFSADGSRYSQIHRVIHPSLRNIVERFWYQDLFLVDPSGNIVYSVHKQVDFATNLATGPYNDSNLAKVFKTALDSSEVGSVAFADIAPYAPYFNNHSSFVATPIFDGATKIGVLIFQLSRHHLEEIMTSNHRWEDIGLGKTGESILVGSDHLLRSESRHLLEDSAAFIQELHQAGVTENTIKIIEAEKTVINNLEFQSPAIDAALNGKSGFIHATNFESNPAIIAYAPISFAGVHWALATLMDKSEAFAIMNEMRNTIAILALVIAGFAALVGWLFARTISRPLAATINILSSSATQMATTTAEQERIANQQAASVNETNTTMEELGISSKQSAQQAQVASDSTQMVMTLAEEGRHQVQDMLHGMEGLRDKVGAIAQQILKLSEQTSQIGNITGMMTDFANETKMLAMNAAVEAVRAGEHGKGFSVLSVEIRKLAEESRRSAERINALVADVQKATNATVMATEEGTKNVEKTIDLAHTTASSFNSVSESMHSASESAQQISLNIKQQAEAIRQVVEAMNDLKTGAREGAAGISQTKAGIQALNEAAKKLKAMT